jgi:hypothetical protein
MNAAFLCQGSDTSTERDKATSAETLRLRVCGVKMAELWERLCVNRFVS